MISMATLALGLGIVASATHADEPTSSAKGGKLESHDPVDAPVRDAEPRVSDQLPEIDDVGGDAYPPPKSASVDAALASQFSPRLRLDDGSAVELGQLGASVAGNVRRRRFSTNVRASYESRKYTRLENGLRLFSAGFGLAFSYQGSAFGFFAGPLLAISAESSADLSRSLTGGGIVGVTWLINPRLLVGVGLYASSQLTGNPLILPVPVFDWRPVDGLRITSFGRYGPGGSVEAIGSPNRFVEISLGVTYRNQQFRLDPDGLAENGTFSTTNVPVWLGVGVIPLSWLRIDGYIGTTFAGSIRFRDARNANVFRSDYEPNFTIGLTLSFELDVTRKPDSQSAEPVEGARRESSE